MVDSIEIGDIKMTDALGRFIKRGDLVYFQPSPDEGEFGIVLDRNTVFTGRKVKFNGSVLLLTELDKDLESVQSELFYKYTMKEKDTLYGEQKPGDVFLVKKTQQGILYDYYWVYLGKSRVEATFGDGYVYRHLYYKLNFLSSYRELYVNTVTQTVNIDLKHGSLIYKSEMVTDFKHYLGNFELLEFDKFCSDLYKTSGDELI